jgi:hypothetical protein
MPPVGGTYPPPPYIYTRAEELLIPFDTDPDVAASLLPEGLELRLPARGVVRFVRHAHSPFGVYNGAYLGLRVTHGEDTLIFVMMGIVDSFVSAAVGREVWGIPKKMGKVEMEWSGQYLRCWAESPIGAKVCEATTQLLEHLPPTPTGGRGPGGVFLRHIPSPERNGRPLVQLIQGDDMEEAIDVGAEAPQSWNAATHLTVAKGSTQDPWDILPVLNVRPARYIKGGTTLLTYGKILREYS